LQARNIIADDRLLELAHHLANTAGEILRKHYRMPVDVDRKADASPVTLADRDVESAMRTLIESHYPEHGIVGEEYANFQEQSIVQWVLDPIDGTRSFIGGYPLFTTLIAVAYHGAPVLGIIDQPISKERWVGLAGEKSTLNGKPITTRHCKTLSEAVIATTSTDYFTPEQTQAFQQIKKQCANSVLGGDAFAYAMLASGQIDVVIDASLKPYDFCALRPVIEGAGGVITDWHGNPLTLSSDGRVAASASEHLHREVLTCLRSEA
jgi:histidinol phosphatase-like enzyme (inositol monophosphatase family)